MEGIRPADNFLDAYNALSLDKELLEDKKKYDAYYVLRENSPIENLKAKIRMDKAYSKILYTGHRKSGKSTELYRLIHDIKDEYFIVFFSVFDELEVSDIKYVDLLLMTALKLCSEAIKESVPFDEDSVVELNKWLIQMSSEVTKSRVEEKSKGKGLVAKLKLLIVEIGADFQTDFSSRVEIRERLEPRTTEVIEEINIITEKIRQSVGKEPIVIIDDLDHVDPDIVWKIFYGYTKSLTRPDCKILFTVPISLIYKREFARIERDFPIREVLPLIKTRNEDGSDNKEGLDCLKEIILRRVSEDLFEKTALNHLLGICNGVLVDLFSVARGCCAKAVASNSDKISWDMVDEEFEKLVNSFRRAIDKKYYPKLEEIKRNKKTDMDSETRDLLEILAVVDYGGGYYYVHPAVEQLLKNLSFEKKTLPKK